MSRASLDRSFESFKTKTGVGESPRPVSKAPGAVGGAYAKPVSRPATLQDITLGTDERGLLLGMTGTGKSVLGEVIIDRWYEDERNSDIIILDTKPRFMAQWQLNGLPAK